MDPARLSGRRLWIRLSVLVAIIATLVWFVPAVMRANQKAPVHGEVGLTNQCVDETFAPPDYGNRESVSYCG